MSTPPLNITAGKPLVVGSFGSLRDLRGCSDAQAGHACDLVEIRLDVLLRDGWQPGETPWSHLRGRPILFTARRESEGGVLALDAATRGQMIAAVIDDAAAVDVEIASLPDMAGTLALLAERGIPWVASNHDFSQIPELARWRECRELAHRHGAAVAKFAAMLQGPEDIGTLENFQRETAALCVSTMGMGPLAPASRVRCALAGSVLNYGYLGQAPTAPGQWPAAELREAIHTGSVPTV